MLLEPADHAVARGQPEGGAAREHDRIHLLDGSLGREQLELARGRGAASDLSRRDRALREQDGGTAGEGLGIGPVADADSRDHGRRLISHGACRRGSSSRVQEPFRRLLEPPPGRCPSDDGLSMPRPRPDRDLAHEDSIGQSGEHPP